MEDLFLRLLVGVERVANSLAILAMPDDQRPPKKRSRAKDKRPKPETRAEHFQAIEAALEHVKRCWKLRAGELIHAPGLDGNKWLLEAVEDIGPTVKVARLLSDPELMKLRDYKKALPAFRDEIEGAVGRWEKRSRLLFDVQDQADVGNAADWVGPWTIKECRKKMRKTPSTFLRMRKAKQFRFEMIGKREIRVWREDFERLKPSAK